MRFLGVGVWLMLFVVGGNGVAPVAAAEPQAVAPVAAAEKEKPKNEKSVVEPIPWPEKYDPRTLKPIRLFMTREEVREIWGEPAKFIYGYSNFEKKQKIRKYFSAEEYEEGLRRYGSLNDVYYRETAKNRYEIVIEFKNAKIDTKIEPEMRVRRVIFLPFTKRSFIEMIEDFPEALALCQHECGMHAHRLTMSVQTFPKCPKATHQAEAQQMAKLWEPRMYEREGAQADWVSVIDVLLRVEMEDLDRNVHQIGWMQRSIRLVMLNFDYPEWYRKGLEIKTKSTLKHGVLDIGSFSVVKEGQKGKVEPK